MFERLSAMLTKEFLQIRRDRGAMLRLIVPLVVQMMVFGYAATFTVHNVSTVVLDLDQSQASRSLISHFVASGRFDVVEEARTDAQVKSAIDQNVALMAIVIHAGFQRDLQNGKGAPLQVILDGTNSNTALIALGYISQIVTQFSSDEASKLLPPHASLARPEIGVTLQTQPWFNSGLEDRWFFIPGVIGSLTLLQVVSLTAFAIVREREVGTLEQIMVSPIRPVEFILGKTVPFFLIGLGDITLVSTIGIFWFKVPFIGDPLVMLAGATLFLLAAIGIGLLLSTFSKTQQQAFSLNFFFVNPLFILSGFAFPIAAMPTALQWFTLINPLRYFLIVIRAVFLKGVGFTVLWPDLAAMAALAAVMLTVSVLRFRSSLNA
ncbi:ABC transporter permease [Metallibacterium scheffleri]|jgi:ABC-2 type transport system permease protein|uniref:ABC transporter permease n=1 Tax=Metallibacterium scheffleri TaxID=993689 RepID=A0A4S3KHF3_9GAMM|nr:ABC transporter permease [Metallibacterium scheffleri]THD08132.1 ABC transporter permease [Metallibacterium scheffleri]